MKVKSMEKCKWINAIQHNQTTLTSSQQLQYKV